MRVVFDTNVVLSALLFGQGKLSWLRTAWRKQELVPVVCKETVSEIMRVLAYPKFQLTRPEQDALLEDFLPHCETYTLSTHLSAPLVCRDTHDQVFLDLAWQASATYLVTGDQDLLVLKATAKDAIAKDNSPKICTPEELKQWVQTP